MGIPSDLVDANDVGIPSDASDAADVLVCGAGTTRCSGACVATEGDVLNCGACGRVCALPHATPACVLGECRIGTCDLNWGHCVGPAADGCETDLQTSDANCGRCGTICAPGSRCIFGGCVALSNYDRAVLADRPTLYLPLDETSGVAVRDLVRGLVGTIRGAVTPGVAGLTAGGSAMNFAGGSIEVPAAAALGTSRFSLEFWARRATADGSGLQAALSMRNGPMCGMTQGFTALVEPGTAGRWQLFTGTRTPLTGLCWDITVGGPPTVDLPRHVVATHDATSLSFYVDGARVAVLAATWIPFAGALLVGAVQNVPGGALSAPFAGVIDNVALYDRALDPTTVARHHDAR